MSSWASPPADALPSPSPPSNMLAITAQELLPSSATRGSPLGKAAHVAIVADVGAEVVAGSTRMKAGTAQKMILNMLSTGAMTRLGYVYGNLMVNVRPKNDEVNRTRSGHPGKSRRTRPSGGSASSSPRLEAACPSPW